MPIALTAKSTFARLALALGMVVAPASLSASPDETTSEIAADPALCEMVEAFDRALQLRYYRANLAPSDIDCNFYSSAGCVYAVRKEVAILVTHAEPIGCDASGDCAFRARQVCASPRPGADCFAIMHAPTSTYVVSGRFTRAEGDERWTLRDWTRTPSGPSIGEHDMTADTAMANVCPSLRG